MYLPLSLLSYTSILGILSTILIVAVVLVDGLSKKHSPGSFWEPAHTSIGPAGGNALALSFGLFMAGVGIISALWLSSLTLDITVLWPRCYS